MVRVMRRTITGTLLITAAAGAAVALSAGAGTASAAMKDGTYQLCLERQYGSSVEQKCTTYRV